MLKAVENTMKNMGTKLYEDWCGNRKIKTLDKQLRKELGVCFHP